MWCVMVCGVSWCVVCHGVWCVMYGVWCVMYGVWCVMYGAWCVMYGVCTPLAVNCIGLGLLLYLQACAGFRCTI